MNRPSLRPATQADIDAFYGMRPTRDLRAWVAELDGQVIGIGGVYDQDGHTVGFSDFKPEMRGHPRTIVEGARLFLKLFGGGPVLALASRCQPEPTAARFLSHLGFAAYHDDATGTSFQRLP